MTAYTFDLRMLYSSGIGRYLSSLVPRLVADAPGIRYRLLCDVARVRRSEGEWVRSANVSLSDARAPIYSLAEQWEIPRAIGAGSDLLWSPHYNIPVAHRGPLVVTVHDLMHLALPEYVPGFHRRAYARAMFRLVARRADRVICVSRFTAGELVRRTGIPASRVEVIHNGVAADWFHVRPEPRPPARPYLLFVGNVKPHKNLRRLVRAFATLAPEIPHDLVVVGQKEGFLTGDEEVERIAARQGGRVRFTGVVDDGALQRLLAGAEMLVFPSLYEGFGLPPLEAMACGCPAVVARAASLPEVCGDAAAYFDPYDPEDMARQIRRVLSDPALRSELVERGREHARAFRWEGAAARTREVLASVASA